MTVRSLCTKDTAQNGRGLMVELLVCGLKVDGNAGNEET